MLPPKGKGALYIQAYPTETPITPRKSLTPLWAPTHKRSPLGRKWREQRTARLEGRSGYSSLQQLGRDWKMEQARRVKGRGPVTATCRIVDDRKLGVEGSGPRGDAHPARLGARRGAGCNLGSQSRRCRSRLVLVAPPRLVPSPAAHFAQRLPRAAAAPVAQKQSPNQGSHQCAPPAPPPATTALAMLLAPLWSTVPLPRPGAARRARGRASGSRGSLASDSAPPPLPKAARQGARSRRWLGTQRKSAPP